MDLYAPSQYHIPVVIDHVGLVLVHLLLPLLMMLFVLDAFGVSILGWILFALILTGDILFGGFLNVYKLYSWDIFGIDWLDDLICIVLLIGRACRCFK